MMEVGDWDPSLRSRAWIGDWLCFCQVALLPVDKSSQTQKVEMVCLSVGTLVGPSAGADVREGGQFRRAKAAWAMCRGQSMGGMLGAAGSCSLVSGSGSGCWSTSSGYWSTSSLPTDRLAAGLMCRGPQRGWGPYRSGGGERPCGQSGGHLRPVQPCWCLFPFDGNRADNEDLLWRSTIGNFQDYDLSRYETVETMSRRGTVVDDRPINGEQLRFL